MYYLGKLAYEKGIRVKAEYDIFEPWVAEEEQKNYIRVASKEDLLKKLQL